MRPDRLRALLAPIGPVLDADMVTGTSEALVPHCLSVDPARSMVRYDLAYGPHRRHRLDLFEPLDRGPRPIFVYVHGGGFSGGDKGGPDRPHYRNVGAWAAENGWTGVVMTYRHAPESRWPGGAEDVARAIAWLADRHAGEDGARSQIFVAGQSAGAVHVADYLAGRAGPVASEVAGAILLSGLYDLVRHERMFFEDAYYGSDPAPAADQSTLAPLLEQAIPLCFTVSEFDPPQFQRQAELVVSESLARSGRWPRMHFLDGHNHISPAMLLGTDGDRLALHLNDFVDQFAARRVGKP